MVDTFVAGHGLHLLEALGSGGGVAAAWSSVSVVAASGFDGELTDDLAGGGGDDGDLFASSDHGDWAACPVDAEGDAKPVPGFDVAPVPDVA
jgi:hypothetical protein